MIYQKEVFMKAYLFTSILLLGSFGCGSDDTDVVSSNGFGEGSANFQVTFESTWSASTHPTDYPSNAHYSPLVGTTHNSSYTMWASGAAASAGVKLVAETGGTSTMNEEIEAQVTAGNAFQVISGGELADTPGTVTFTFGAKEDFPRLSIITMIAPSPDWFVGIRDVELYNASTETWIDETTIDLFPYDAGTDSGSTFTSANAVTDPAGNITLLTAPFTSGVKLGTLKIKRME